MPSVGAAPCARCTFVVCGKSRTGCCSYKPDSKPMWKPRRLGDVCWTASSIAARATLPPKSVDANILGPDRQAMGLIGGDKLRLENWGDMTGSTNGASLVFGSKFLRTLQGRSQLRQKPLGLALARLPCHSEKCGCGAGGKTHVRVDHKISVFDRNINQ